MDDASLRASDTDRERAVVVLREHLVAGRLTLGEFSDRVDAALRARVTGELVDLQDDLPEALSGPVPSSRRPARFIAALMSHVVRRGQLRLRRRALAVSVLGDLDLDLRSATMDAGQATVSVFALFGNVDVYVPEGVNVDVGGVAIFGHRRDWGRDLGLPDAPGIYVRVLGFGGTVDVWRVPRTMRDSSYREILRGLGNRRQLPAE